jgi:hypothetical protein
MIDVVYQIVELSGSNLGAALITAQIVALVPYFLFLGLVNRMAVMLRH